MRYIVDNDLHIHSQISLCSNDPEQTTQRILQYAEENGLSTICLTDHFWDADVKGASSWYELQDYKHISAALPLPKSDKVNFLFGCETELNSDLTVGVAPQNYELFDFVIIPTTHFHMKGYTITDEQGATSHARAKVWVERMDAVLDMDLPFKKVGLAHLTCGLIAPERNMFLEIIDLLPEEDLFRVFTKAAKVGVGIELNSSDMNYAESEADTVLRPYKIAKQCGCKFYLGSDAHHVKELLRAKSIFERAVDALGLTEDDKFIIGK